MPPLHPVHHELADVSREVRALWDELDAVRRSDRSDGTPAPGPGGVTHHGFLTGLLNDDHPQYLTEARGDARYYTKAQVDALLADILAAGYVTGTGAVNRLARWTGSSALGSAQNDDSGDFVTLSATGDLRGLKTLRLTRGADGRLEFDYDQDGDEFRITPVDRTLGIVGATSGTRVNFRGGFLYFPDHVSGFLKTNSVGLLSVGPGTALEHFEELTGTGEVILESVGEEVDAVYRAKAGQTTKIGRAGEPIRMGTLNGLVRADDGLIDAMPFAYDAALRAFVVEGVQEII